LQGDVLFLGVSPQLTTTPRIYVHVLNESSEKPELRFRFIKACRLQSCSDLILEVVSKSEYNASQPTMNITVRPFVAEGQKENFVRRLNFIQSVLSNPLNLPDLRYFPIVTSCIPAYCQRELDSYHAHVERARLGLQKQPKNHVYKTAQEARSSGSCSKRASVMLSKCFDENNPNAGSNVHSSTLPKPKHWLSTLKDAQGRSSSYKSSTKSTEVAQSNKISQYFGPSPNLEGFKNLGNTCYMSAIVSVLLSLPALAADIEIFSKAACTKADRDARVLNAFHELFQQSRVKNHGVLNSSELKNAVAARAKCFKGREQQDAHEFYSSCLDLLTTEIEQIIKKRLKKYENESAEKQESESDFRMLSVTDLNFNLKIRHTLVCANSDCSYKRSRGELFREISLSIPDIDSEGSASTHDILDSFFDANHLDYKCEKCGHFFANATHKVSLEI
jgi:hypothetical protein